MGCALHVSGTRPDRRARRHRAAPLSRLPARPRPPRGRRSRRPRRSPGSTCSPVGMLLSQHPLGCDVYLHAMRIPLAALALAGLVLAGSAVARTIEGTDRNDRLVGTPRADSILGRRGSDRIVGLAGADFLSGGAGRDVGRRRARERPHRRAVRRRERPRPLRQRARRRERRPRSTRSQRDCELIARRLSRDPYTDPEAQHETEVEPDSLTVGRTTVAAFQVGRRFDGAATNVGFAVSSDDGRTWRSGLLPGLTRASVPAGTNVRATDPAVAYDATSGTWLIGTLALGAPETRLTVSRSSDGFTWGEPVTAIEDTRSRGSGIRQELAHVRQRPREPVPRPLLPRLHGHAADTTCSPR